MSMWKTLGKILPILIMVFAIAAIQGTAEAQQKRRARKVIRLGKFVIEGRVQKPQAFYILQRSNLNFEGLELKNTFVPKIIESVEQPPF